jgi:hypothetical protein
MKKIIKWLKSFKKKEKCYGIHFVQSRMLGCDYQCNECKLKQQSKKNK